MSSINELILALEKQVLGVKVPDVDCKRVMELLDALEKKIHEDEDIPNDIFHCVDNAMRQGVLSGFIKSLRAFTVGSAMAKTAAELLSHNEDEDASDEDPSDLATILKKQNRNRN